jgi:hypothetical protein
MIVGSMTDKKQDAGSAAVQIVFVKWGTRYGADTINRHVRAIGRHATCDFTVTCITDDFESAYDPRIDLKPFPEFVAPFEYLKQGCRLKMAMFAPGMLKPGIPAVFCDLDSMILGDVKRLADYVRRHRGISMLSNHYVQWWPVQRYVRPLLGGKTYFANSSVMGFMPEDYEWLFETFNREVTDAIPVNRIPRRHRADDRFISYHAWDGLRVFPSSLAVKYFEEYMAPSLALETVRKRLPWVARRRERQVAITFGSMALKPEAMHKLKLGDVIHHKRLSGYWDVPDHAEYWLEPVEIG